MSYWTKRRKINKQFNEHLQNIKDNIKTQDQNNQSEICDLIFPDNNTVIDDGFDGSMCMIQESLNDDTTNWNENFDEQCDRDPLSGSSDEEDDSDDDKKNLQTLLYKWAVNN